MSRHVVGRATEPRDRVKVVGLPLGTRASIAGGAHSTGMYAMGVGIGVDMGVCTLCRAL